MSWSGINGTAGDSGPRTPVRTVDLSATGVSRGQTGATRVAIPLDPTTAGKLVAERRKLFDGIQGIILLDTRNDDLIALKNRIRAEWEMNARGDMEGTLGRVADAIGETCRKFPILREEDVSVDAKTMDAVEHMRDLTGKIYTYLHHRRIAELNAALERLLPRDSGSTANQTLES